MHLLIDADSALYKAGCKNEERSYLCILDGHLVATLLYKKDALALQEEIGCEIEKTKTAGPIRYSLSNLRNIVEENLLSIPHSSYSIYIGGTGNFRYQYFPEYKKGRDEDSKPIHLEEMKKHLIGRYGAIVVDGEEVDDRISWEQCLAPDRQTCIVSIDKDLNNTPGLHYNYDSKESYYLTKEEANLNFARQLLTGDSTDGIPGIKGIGAKSASKLLPDGCTDWLDRVRSIYSERSYTEEYLVQMGRCLWMRRKPNEIWDLDYDYTS